MPEMIPANDLPAAAALDADPVRGSDVPGALRAVHPVGDFISVRADEMDPELYTTRPENSDGIHNHFQGIQRLNDGRHIVISGSNWRSPPRGSEIYIAEMGSRSDRGPWLSNLTSSREPPAADRIVAGITIDPVSWHAGGMDVLGPILAVAIRLRTIV